MIRLPSVIALLVLVGLSAAPAQAQAPLPDPDAPAGASREWLPSDPWVMQRWLPYSEDRLNQVLRTDRYELGPWLRVGQRDLADLARAKGLSATRAVRLIMAPERKRVSRRQFRVLSARAQRTFTQRHLMQHMLFHNFHTGGANTAWRLGTGLSWEQIGQQKRQGYSLAQMAERNGRSRDSLFAGVRAAVLNVSREGIRTRSTSNSQAASQRDRDFVAIVRYGDYRSGAKAGAASSPPPAALCFLHRR